MCGIVGIVERDLERPIVRDELLRMVQMLRHRGPDEEGHLVLPGVALGMRRLSIIDVRGGQQPFRTEDGSIHLVANGEIYNFMAIRQDLESEGIRFRTESDTEVILAAYARWGGVRGVWEFMGNGAG